jgi:hypothetical protein
VKVGILGSGDVNWPIVLLKTDIVEIGTRNPNQQKLIEWMTKHNDNIIWRNRCYSNFPLMPQKEKRILLAKDD